MKTKRAGSRTPRRVGTALATSVLALTGLTFTAAPAQAQTQAPNCWGSYTIYPDGVGFIRATASTNCDHQATQMGVSVTIRERDQFGFVMNCGSGGPSSAMFATHVSASATCISKGRGYTYWAYSSNWADIDGQRLEFNSGNWNG